MLAPRMLAPLVREHPAATEVFDQDTRKAFGGFGFRGPGGDPLVERLVEQCAVVVEISGQLIASMLCLTSRRHSLPDEVRGSVPGAVDTSMAGTTHHTDTTRATH